MKKRIISSVLVLVIISVVLVIIFNVRNEKENHNVNEKNTINIENEGKEINFKTAHDILSNQELRALSYKITAKMLPDNTNLNAYSSNPEIFILPEKLNGIKCNTLDHKSFLNDYNHTYDGLILSLPKGTVTISAEIIKEVRNVKVDTGTEIKNIQYSFKNNTITLNIQEEGIHIIEAEMENDTFVKIIFDVSLVKKE